MMCAPSGHIHWAATSFTTDWYGLHGSLRRLGHAGRGVGTCTPGTTGRMRLDGMAVEKAIDTVAFPLGTVWPKDHTGWVPFGAEIVT